MFFFFFWEWVGEMPLYDCLSSNFDFYGTFSIQELEVLALLAIVNFLMDISSTYSCLVICH